jgi:glycosyltransferase involved in cell wall biosynthesis
MISFVVPAYNEERLLGRTLAALHSAASGLGQSYELIVVDDGSTDATVTVALALGARVVPVEFRQIGRARNAGALAAIGSTLIFVDADTLVPEATLRATIEALRRGAVGGGATVLLDGRLPVWAWVLLPIIRGVLRAGRLASGCYVFCSRAAFDAVGGFDDRLFAAEEIAFSRSLRRLGPVVILRETVTTSGRKLRSHSGWDVLRLCVAGARQGNALILSRERLSIWYGERRHDPE